MGGPSGQVQGADPEQLDATARQFTEYAEHLERSSKHLSAMLAATDWVGGDADRFRSAWASEHTVMIRSAAACLRDAGGRLRANADEQRRASAADGTGPATGVGTAPAGSGPGTGEHARRFAATRAGMEADLADRRAHLADLERRLAHVDGGAEEWFKDVVPIWNSDAEALRTAIERERRAIGRLEGLLADPSRMFLKVDVDGDGRIIEVHGDLDSAERVAIFVPGVDTDVDAFTRHGHDYAVNLHDEMARQAPPGTAVAVVSYLDYDPPDLDASLPLAAGEARADEGARNLAGFVDQLQSSGIPADRITAVGHSYGSTVIGISMEHHALDVSTVAVVGSPGMGDGVDDVSDLGRSDVRVFAGKSEGVALPGGDGDPVSWAPAHGEDPADDGFGASRFSTDGASGHSGYFSRNTESLANLARIALGTSPTGP